MTNKTHKEILDELNALDKERTQGLFTDCDRGKGTIKIKSDSVYNTNSRRNLKTVAYVAINNHDADQNTKNAKFIASAPKAIQLCNELYAMVSKWQTVDTAPHDKELLLGWWYTGTPEPVFRYEICKYSWGYENGFGSSRGQHGRAEYWAYPPTPPQQPEESE